MSGWTDGRTPQRTTGGEREGVYSSSSRRGHRNIERDERSEVITESERALPPSLPFLGTKLLRFRQAPPLQEEAVALLPFVRPPPSLTADFLPLRFDYVCLGLAHSGGGNEDDNGQFKPLSLLSFERSSRSRYRTKSPFKMPGMRSFRFQCGLKQNEQSTKDRGRVTRAFWDVDLCSTGAKPTIAQN